MGIFGNRKKFFDAPQKIIGSHSFRTQGKDIACPHCGCEQFELGSALLNTAGMTFFNLDWANRSAAFLTCTKCTHLQWFLRQPEVVG